VSLGVPLVLVPGDGTDPGVGGFELSALYGFNSETPRLPAFAVRAGVERPTGAFGPAQVLGAVGGVLTRGFGRTRLHLNGSWMVGPVAEEARWRASLALDRTLLFASTLLATEVVVDGADDGGTATVVAAGVRRQITPMLVVDAGVAAGIQGDAPDVALTVGLSRVFGIPGLVRVPRPQPAGGAAEGHHHGS
jgi:hypothetical protein